MAALRPKVGDLFIAFPTWFAVTGVQRQSFFPGQVFVQPLSEGDGVEVPAISPTILDLAEDGVAGTMDDPTEVT